MYIHIYIYMYTHTYIYIDSSITVPQPYSNQQGPYVAYINLPQIHNVKRIKPYPVHLKPSFYP